jgi:hypothetical protein
MTSQIDVCLICNREHLATSDIPLVNMHDGKFLCAACVDSAARGLARWRARRKKRAEIGEAERQARLNAERYYREHTLFRPPAEPAYAPLTPAQMVMVRQALTRIAPKDRPEFLQMMHDEARDHAHWKHKTVDNDFVRSTIELLVAALSDGHSPSAAFGG